MKRHCDLAPVIHFMGHLTRYLPLFHTHTHATPLSIHLSFRSQCLYLRSAFPLSSGLTKTLGYNTLTTGNICASVWTVSIVQTNRLSMNDWDIHTDSGDEAMRELEGDAMWTQILLKWLAYCCHDNNLKQVFLIWLFRQLIAIVFISLCVYSQRETCDSNVFQQLSGRGLTSITDLQHGPSQCLATEMQTVPKHECVSECSELRDTLSACWLGSLCHSEY